MTHNPATDSVVRRSFAPPAPIRRGSWWLWGVVTVLVAVGTYALAGVWHGARLAQVASWVVIGLVLLPAAFAGAVAFVGSALLALLGALSLPARLAGRRVGLSGVARDLGRLVVGIPRDYLRALRRVQNPTLWGVVTGFVLGVVVRIAAVGLLPA